MHMDESCQTYVCDMAICVTWLVHMCDMTHSYVWHGSFICVNVCVWYGYMCDMTRSYVWHVWHDSCICVTWLIHMCERMCEPYHTYEWAMAHICTDMSHEWMCHVTHRIRYTTHIKVLCHTYECVTSRIWRCHTYERVMSHICMSHVTHKNELCHAYEQGMSRTWMCHMNVSCHSCECVMSRVWTSKMYFDGGCRIYCNTLQHTATHCKWQQNIHIKICILMLSLIFVLMFMFNFLISKRSDGNCILIAALHYDAIHCDTLQYTATHCDTLRHTATHCDTLQHTATHCNTL